MTNEEVLARIDELVAKEHRLRDQGHALSDDDRAELRAAEEHLDQLWDLMRRRDAARRQGKDPEAVPAESIDRVEHYLQ
jgi:hypothetical protein